MIRGIIFWAAIAAASTALGQSVNVSISPTMDLSHVELGAVLDGSSHNFGTVFDIENLPDITANTTYINSVSLSFPYNLPVLGYTLMAVYTNGGQTGATICFSSTAGAALISSSSPWPFTFDNETAFISDPYLAYFNDQDQADALLYQMTANASLAPAAPNTFGQLVNFSNATNGGTMTLSTTPEPASYLAFGAGLLVLMRRRARSISR